MIIPRIIIVGAILSVIIYGIVFKLPLYEILSSQEALISQEEKKVEIQKEVFGTSAQNKSIEGYEVGHGENVIFLFGAIHGNEMGTADLLENLAGEIKKDVSKVSENNKVIILPIANPDGYYDRTDKLNANEVNLNINFETSQWQKYGPQGHFAGDQPFSETESRVIRDIVEKYKPDIMIAFHAQGSLVSPESSEGSINLAKWYAKKTGYQYFDEWDFAGTATRWFTETTGNPSITVELSDHLKNDWDINRKALLELISHSHYFY